MPNQFRSLTITNFPTIIFSFDNATKIIDKVYLPTDANTNIIVGTGTYTSDSNFNFTVTQLDRFSHTTII